MVFSSSAMGIVPGGIPANYFYDTPAAVIGRPLLEAGTLFAYILITMLALNWAWRQVWALCEGPATLRDPGASIRWTILLLLLSALLRVVPDTVLAMSWAELTPRGRYDISTWDRVADIVSAVPFVAAWGAAYIGGPMVFFQLRREPLPLHLFPTWRQSQRPLKIALACLVLALALTFLR